MALRRDLGLEGALRLRARHRSSFDALLGDTHSCRRCLMRCYFLSHYICSLHSLDLTAWHSLTDLVRLLLSRRRIFIAW